MVECNPLPTLMEHNLKLTSIEGKKFEDAIRYRQLVGILNYLTTTRPNISFVVGILSRFMQNPCKGHWFAAKRVLKYLKGTQDFRLEYTQVGDFSLIGYSDSYFDGDKKNWGIYFRLCYESWIRSCLLEIMQTISSSRFHNRGRICGSC